MILIPAKYMQNDARSQCFLVSVAGGCASAMLSAAASTQEVEEGAGVVGAPAADVAKTTAADVVEDIGADVERGSAADVAEDTAADVAGGSAADVAGGTATDMGTGSAGDAEKCPQAAPSAPLRFRVTCHRVCEKMQRHGFTSPEAAGERAALRTFRSWNKGQSMKTHSQKQHPKNVGSSEIF